MTIMQSWKEGFGFFKKDVLWQLFLITMKNTGDIYKMLLVYWISMVAGKLGLYYIFPHPLDPSIVPFVAGARFSWIVGKAYNLVFLYFVCLAARPSIERKTGKYFFGRLPDLLRMLVAQSVLGSFFLLFFGLPLYLVQQSQSLQWMVQTISNAVQFIMVNKLHPSLWVVINILFLADADSLWRSIRNTVRFVVYNYPLLFILSNVCFALLWIGWQVEALFTFFVYSHPFLSIALSWTGYFIFWPFIVVLFTNVYVKRSYEHAHLYK